VFVRSAELRYANWSEFDLDNAQWKIPADRMKMRIAHIVPLSTQAVAILRELPEECASFMARSTACETASRR
jgi:integrase